MAYRCCAFPLKPEAIKHYGDQLGQTTPEAALYGLAEAIAIHPMWQGSAQGVCVVRSQPTPQLAILGNFSPKLWEQIGLQRGHLNQVCQRLRYVSYPDVTTICEQLADQLRSTFDPKTLSELQFYGVPRGGLMVLGILSYLLGLRHEQLYSDVTQDSPLVIVDDCALSGARFRRVLTQYPQRKLILATLYAHPALRTAIATQEPNVMHCLSGTDLVDHGPRLMGANYPAWQAENQGRLAGHRYWLGLPDYVCFPWNEPDHLIWNSAIAELEKSWAIMPPSHCIKHRSPVSSGLPIQIQPPLTGWLQPTEQTIFGELNGHILIGNLATGETFGLSPKAADFWRVMIKADSWEDAIAQLTPQYPDPHLHADVTTLLEALMQQQLLQPLTQP